MEPSDPGPDGGPLVRSYGVDVCTNPLMVRAYGKEPARPAMKREL